jgi:hypothetical protein
LCGQIADLSEDDVAWLEGLNAPRLNQERKRRGDSPLALWNYRTELLRAVAPRLLAADFGARWVRRSDAWGTKKEASLPPDSRRQKRLLSSVRHVFEKWIGNLRLGGPGLEGLEVLLRVCRERGIPVALVVMPEGPEFRSWYRDGSREAVLLEAQQMGRRWDCSLINAWEWFPEPAFRDSLHLASDAAEEFSRRLASEELAPLLDRAVSVARAAAPHRSRR